MPTFFPEPANNWSDLGGLAAGDLVDGQGQTWSAALAMTVSGTAGAVVTFDDFTISRPGSCITATGVDNIVLTDVELTASAAGAAGVNVGGGCLAWTIRGLRGDSCDSHAIFSTGPDAGNYCDGWLVSNSVFIDCGVWGDTGDSTILATVYVRRFTVQDCVFLGDGSTTGVSGIEFNPADGGGDGNGHHVERIYSTGHEEQAIAFKGNSESAASEGDTILADAILAEGYGSNDGAVNWAFGSSGGQFQRVEITGSNGIFIGNALDTASGDVEVVGLLMHDASGLGVTEADDTLEGNWRMRQCTFAEIGSVWSFSESFRLRTDGWVFRNCIFSNCSLASSVSRPLRWTTGFDTADLDGSCYHLSDAGTVVAWDEEGVSPNDFLTLAELQGLGHEASGIQADPLFINSSSEDYRLDGGSPCIGAGVRWWGTDTPPQGVDGLRFPLRAGKPDMGAYSVRPGEDGATRTAAAYVPAVLESGVDIPKAKRA